MESKNLIALLFILSSVSAYSWHDYCALPLDQKMAIQHDSLLAIANGTVASDYLSPKDAADILGITPLDPPTHNVTMIKVGGVYVSDTICKANPSECEVEAPAPIVQPQVNYSRTPEECLQARQEDWQALVWNYAGEGYDLANTDSANKEGLLDNAALGSQSKQYICLHGGPIS